MRRTPIPALTLVVLAAPAPAQHDATPQDAAATAAPVRLRAGDALAGVDRKYPSPVLLDVDGDGDLDLVVGALFGNVIIANERL